MTDPEQVKAATDEAAEAARDDRAHKTLLVLGIVGAVGVLLLAGALLWQNSQIASQRTQVAELRDAGNVTAAQAQQLAQQIRAMGGTPVVQPATPGPSGPQGIPGTPGRGIASTALATGHLIVTYTDGTTADLGQVAGAPGAAGRSITSTTISAGHLVVSYSDGTSTDAGQVVGRDGRGVSQILADSAGHLMIVYSDGTTSDAGQLPPGPAGATGPQGVSVTDVRFTRDPSGTCQAVITLHDPATGHDTTITHPAGAAACPVTTGPAKTTR